MATILLGVAYEFSSADSPLPRAELHALLVKSLGKDNYALKIKQFKANPVFKDFEQALLLTFTQDDTGLPNVYFTTNYVDLIKENLRIKRALTHDPLGEPRGKISYELFEELDSKVSDLTKELKLEKEKAVNNDKTLNEKISELSDLSNKLELKLEDNQKELAKVKEDHAYVSEKLSTTTQNLSTMETSKKEFETLSQKYHKELQEALKKGSSSSDLSKQLKEKLDTTEQAKKKLEDGINNMTRDLFQFKKQK